MLARRTVPRTFEQWNRYWQAPFGPPWLRWLPMHRRFNRAAAALMGPFAFQENNSTRIVEYPWSFQAGNVCPGQRILEIGGGLSGFQFVLAKTGADVINVDPFVDYGQGMPYPKRPEQLHARLNGYFRTQVDLRRTTLAGAGLADASFDRAYSISTLEHLNDDDIVAMLRAVRGLLRPGGRFVLTVDLFLDLSPFTTKSHNRWGRNISMKWVTEQSCLRLVEGDSQELCGFAEFDRQRILAGIDAYLIGMTPAAAQLCVLQKDGGPQLDGPIGASASVLARSAHHPPGSSEEYC